MTLNRILTDPELQRVRENITEFTGQALMAKAFRVALAPVKDIRDGSIHRRLVRAFAEIKNFSEEDHGQRSIRLSEFKEWLKGFELNGELPITEVLTAGFTSTPSASRNSATLQGTVDAKTAVTAPPGATHFQLMQLLALVSDTEYNTDNNKYVLSVPDASQTAIATPSEFIPINADEPVSVSLETTLPVETISDHVTVIEGLGIRFYKQMKNGKFLPLKQGKAMQLVNLF